MKPKIKNFLSITKTHLQIQKNKNFKFFLGFGLASFLAYSGVHRIMDISSSAETIKNVANLMFGGFELIIGPALFWTYQKTQKSRLTSTEFMAEDSALKQQLSFQKDILAIHKNQNELQDAIPVPAFEEQVFSENLNQSFSISLIIMKPQIKNFLSITKTHLQIQTNKNIKLFLGLGTMFIFAYFGVERLMEISSSAQMLENVSNLVSGGGALMVAPALFCSYKKMHKTRIINSAVIEKDNELKQKLSAHKDVLTIHQELSDLENAVAVPTVKSQSAKGSNKI